MKAVVYARAEYGHRPSPGETLQPPAHLNLIQTGKAKPSWIVSHELPLHEAPGAYEHFDARDEGWTKVVLHPEMIQARA